jgi:DNA-directed RNA polymerase beta subunit
MKTPIKNRNPKYNYNKIDEKGLIKPGTIVHKGDVIVGKVGLFII